MRRIEATRFSTFVAIGLLVALCGSGVGIAACSSSATSAAGDQGAGPDGGSAVTTDPDDPINQPPHALGTIVVGEAHTTGSSAASASTPIVSAVFVPDALKARACKTPIDPSCDFVPRVACSEVKGSVTGCDTGKACIVDEGCNATCKRVCSKTCAKDEVCTIDDAGKDVCTNIEHFDAGLLTLSGTKSDITLTPPYTYGAIGKGAPFTERADLRVQAEGAAGAGFEAFDEAFMATTFVETSPALTSLTRNQVFAEKGSVPVSWKSGEDAILITLAGRGGTVTCRAQDSAGTFDVPRAAFTEAIGGEPGFPLNVAVTRQRRDTKKGKKTVGELTNSTIQSEGWLDLVSMSTESTQFQGCPDVASMCGSTGCVNLKSDSANCGACGKACTGGTTCVAGSCVAPANACDACLDAAEVGACKVKLDACKANPDCNARMACDNACTTDQCASQCFNTYPASEFPWDALVTCMSDECGGYCP